MGYIHDLGYSRSGQRHSFGTDPPHVSPVSIDQPSETTVLLHMMQLPSKAHTVATHLRTARSPSAPRESVVGYRPRGHGGLTQESLKSYRDTIQMNLGRRVGAF